MLDGLGAIGTPLASRNDCMISSSTTFCGRRVGLPSFAETEQAGAGWMRQDLDRALYYRGFLTEVLPAV
jgi:hypothetical protein